MKRKQLSEDIEDTLMDDFHDEELTCPACNTIVEFYWEPRYNGIRGRCNFCGTNWAES